METPLGGIVKYTLSGLLVGFRENLLTIFSPPTNGPHMKRYIQPEFLIGMNPNHLGPAVLFCQLTQQLQPWGKPAFGMGCHPLSAKAAMHLQSSWIGMVISWRYHGIAILWQIGNSMIWLCLKVGDAPNMALSMGKIGYTLLFGISG